MFYPISFTSVEAPAQKTADELFLTDYVLGWRPALGTHMYDESGIIFSRSSYPKVAGPKVLMIGDSPVRFPC